MSEDEPPTKAPTSEISYQTVFDNMLEGLQIIGFDWRYRYLNATAIRHSQKTPAELLGYTMMECYPGIEHTALFAVLQRCMQERVVERLENAFTYPDGSQAWFELSIQPIPDGILILSLDISRRKQSETALLESEQRLRLFVEHAPAAIAMLDENMVYLSVSQRWLTDYRLPEQNVLGRSHYEIFPDLPEPWKAVHRRCLKGAIEKSESDPFPRADGTLDWIRWEIHPWRKADDTIGGIFILSEIVTERKLAEMELEALYNATSHLFNANDLLSLGRQIVEAVVQEFDYADCGLMLVDWDQNRVTRLARTGAYNIHPETPLTLDGAGLVPLAIRSGELVYVPDVRLDPHYLANADQTRSELVIPLKTARGLIAIFDLQSAEVDAFSLRDQRILTAYAERAAAALESMQLHEALNRHAVKLEWQVAQRTAELQAAKERVEAILNNSLDGILLVHTDLTIRQTNAAFDKLFACEVDAYFNQPLTALLAVEDANLLSELIGSGKHSLEARAQRLDGTSFEAEFSLGAIKGDGVVCTIRDITERKRAEEALNTRLKEEQEFQAYLKALHDITIELTQVDDLDTFYRRTIELGLERLGFERLAMFLYEEKEGLAQGTYGTDAQGRVVDEQHIRFTPNPQGVMVRALDQVERFYLDEAVSLYAHHQPIGAGWNAATVLWNGTQSLGWLLADNLLSQTPASKPLRDIMGLYGLTIGTLLAQKQTQIALRESEERFRQIAENIDQILFVRSGDDQKMLYISPAYETIWGKSCDSLYAAPNSFLEGVHPDDLVYVQQNLSQRHYLETGFADFEHRIIPSSGIVRWVRVRIFPIKDKAGAIMRRAGIIEDITERKQVEQAIQKYIAEIYDLYNNAPCGYHSVNKEGVIVQINDTELKWLGYSRAEVLHKLKFSDLVTPESRQVFQRNFPIFLQQGWINDLEFDLVRKDGSTFSIILSATAIKDAEGQFLHSRSTLFDISERKHAEHALQESEEKYRSLVETMRGGLGIYDINNRVTFVNDRYCELVGYSREELLGKIPYHYMSQASAELVEKQLERRRWLESSSYEIEVNHKNGTTIHLLISGSPLLNKQGEFSGSVAVLIDITAQKQAEATLRQALAKEKELGELKSRFVSLASHEFRTPLATILATTETLVAYRQRMTDEQIGQRLGKIQDQVDRLKDIMEDVLLLARMQARRVQFEPALINLDELCHSILDEFQSHPQMKHQVEYSCDPVLEQVVLDKKLMRQIILNLISNALKYSPGEKAIKITLTQEQENVVLRVSDQGMGIPEADLPHIFEPFHRAANIGAIAGTGLGLVITKESVELQGGMIALESREGVGTTFTVKIPFRRGEP